MASEIIAQIADHNEFIQSRVGDASSHLVDSFKAGCLCHINQLNQLLPSDAVKINTALGSSVYPEQMQKELQGAVDKLVQVGVSSTEVLMSTVDSKKQQELNKFGITPQQKSGNCCWTPRICHCQGFMPCAQDELGRLLQPP